MLTGGWFAIGIDHPKTEMNVGTLWRHAVAFGAAAVFTIGRRYRTRQASDTVDTAARIPCLHFATAREMRAVWESAMHGCVVVGVERDDRATALPAFRHPAQAVYVLGAEDHGLTTETRAVCRRLVTIPYAADCLNVAGAGTVVLYDRAVKRSQTP